jgi:hypothetical protein
MAVLVLDVGDRGHVDRMAEPPVAAQRQPEAIFRSLVAKRCARSRQRSYCIYSLVSAPSRIRTCDLLLRSNLAVDAVAICDDTGHVSGGTHCCSPSYLVIANQGFWPHDRHRGRGMDRIAGSGSRPPHRPWPIGGGHNSRPPGTAYRVGAGTPGCPPQSGDLELLVAEVGDELEGAAKGRDIAVQDILSGDVSSFDLGNPGN